MQHLITNSIIALLSPRTLAGKISKAAPNGSAVVQCFHSTCIALGPTDAKEIGQAMPIIESKSMDFDIDKT